MNKKECTCIKIKCPTCLGGLDCPHEHCSSPEKPECICADNDGKGKSTCGVDCPEHTKPEWEKAYRQKYEGANVWSSKAIDSQIEDIKHLLSQQKAELREKTRTIIACDSCNGSGRADSMNGASECQSCGGDGHRLYGREGETIEDILEALK